MIGRIDPITQSNIVLLLFYQKRYRPTIVFAEALDNFHRHNHSVDCGLGASV